VALVYTLRVFIRANTRAVVNPAFCCTPPRPHLSILAPFLGCTLTLKDNVTDAETPVSDRGHSPDFMVAGACGTYNSDRRAHEHAAGFAAGMRGIREQYQVVEVHIVFLGSPLFLSHELLVWYDTLTVAD